MIAVEIKGGLGNQIFMLAAAIEQARRLHTSVELLPQYPEANTHARTFELSSLHLPNFVTVSTQNKNALPASLRRKRVFDEASFAYDHKIQSVKDNTTLRGYFQSWRYFENSSTIMAETLLGSTHTSPTDNRIALHIRLGDYLTQVGQSFHGTLTLDYYTRALNLLAPILGEKPSVLLFSDQPELALQRIPQSWSVDVADETMSTIETLRAMSRCAAVVTANSSFSWWAGWLASRRGAPVICPRNWFVTLPLVPADLFPPSWIALGDR